MRSSAEGEGTGGRREGDAGPGAATTHVLVVDDDQVDRLAVRRHLAGAGTEIEVVEAEGVLDAIDRLSASQFDCVLLDFNLPDGDGLTFLRGMRNAGLSVPVIILTGQDDPGVTVDLMLAGAADYIPKESLSPERLVRSLRAARPSAEGGSAAPSGIEGTGGR